MRYFVAIVIVICAGLSLSSIQPVNSVEVSAEKNFPEITCEVGEGFVCVENITFPAMHINANIEK